MTGSPARFAEHFPLLLMPHLKKETEVDAARSNPGVQFLLSHFSNPTIVAFFPWCHGRADLTLACRSMGGINQLDRTDRIGVLVFTSLPNVISAEVECTTAIIEMPQF